MQGLNPLTMQCTYSTPCGWCTKWDKRCDKKIGCSDDSKHKRGIRANVGVYDDAMSPCVTYEPCPYCESYEYGDQKCSTCRENSYKFFKAKEN